MVRKKNSLSEFGMAHIGASKQAKSCRVVLIDDHVSVRELVASLLLKEGNYELVGQARTGWEGIKLCEKTRPDLAIVDLLLPELNGVEVVRKIRNSWPQTRVMIYSGTSHVALATEALQARPHGYVQKQDSLSIFRDGVRTVAEGRDYFCGFASKLMHLTIERDLDIASLSERERIVLQMVAEGWQTKEIAERLHLSPKSVERDRTVLMKKLNRRDVAGLTRIAIKHGLVLPE